MFIVWIRASFRPEGRINFKKRVKTVNLKKIVSAFLCMLLLVLAVVPCAAAEAVQSVVVSVLYADGETIRPFMDLTVSDGVSEAYGYTVADVNHNGEAIRSVTVLDALVQAHAETYGTAYTAQSAKDYFYVNNGYATSAFGASKMLGFAVNGATPHDDKLVTSEWGSYYTGYAMDEAVVQDGDVITLYAYTDTQGWSDLFPIFSEKSMDLQAGEQTAVTIRGYSMGFYGCNEQSVIDANTIPLTGAAVSWTQDFKTYQPAGSPDALGKLELTAPQTEGEWYLVVRGAANGTPVVASACCVHVGEDPAKDARWFPIGLRPVCTLRDKVLTIGVNLHLRDRNGKADDCWAVYALQIVFNGLHTQFRILHGV